jgi:hypothetical protein
MRTFKKSAAVAGVLLAACLSGCGIIGGAFTLPEDEPAQTAAAGAGPGAGQTLDAQPTPLPLQPVTPLPTGIAQLPVGCVNALDVTIEDYGESMCVGGTVYLILQEHGTYYVRFSSERGTLYMQGDEWVDRIGLRAGECAYAEGKISRNIQAAAPVMPITPFSLKRCPVAPPAAAPLRPDRLPADCLFALEVTRDDVGRTKCVGGTVAFSEWNGGVYNIYFYTDKGLGLHLVSTQWTGRGVDSGACIYVTEERIEMEEGTDAPIVYVVPGNVTQCPA